LRRRNRGEKGAIFIEYPKLLNIDIGMVRRVGSERVDAVKAADDPAAILA
jgi:hypothetical protein